MRKGVGRRLPLGWGIRSRWQGNVAPDNAERTEKCSICRERLKGKAKGKSKRERLKETAKGKSKRERLKGKAKGKG